MEASRETRGQESVAVSVEELERLKGIVRQRRVVWEVWPVTFVLRGGGTMKVGYELLLSGAHEHGWERPNPGCDKCRAIFRDLQEVARWIIPKVERASQYEIEVFDQAIHYAPERGNRPDVSLSIKILHRQQLERPVDECEVLCLDEMKAKLSQIGAQHRQWKET
jgi:hypothetical protein